MNKFINVRNITKQIDKDLNKFILDNESKYRGQLFTLSKKIIDEKNISIVLLAGPSCAGKTTTANLLKQIFELKGRNVDVISMDDFFIDLDKRKLLPNGNVDFDSPDILNYELMKDTFSRYFSGEEVYFPEYDFKNGKSIPNKNRHEYKYNSIIIFEGIHVLNPRVLENLGTDNYFRLYVSPITSFKTDDEQLSTKNLRLLRRIVRDIKRRNTPAQKTIDMWPEVVAVEEQYIEPFRTKVDYYVDTTHIYELGIYKSELEKFVEEKKIEKEDIPFQNFLNKVDCIDKSVLSDTSLMWEFVDKD